MSDKPLSGEETKELVVSIHELLPDDPVDALSILAFAYAFAVVGMGFSRHVADAGLDVAFDKAKQEALRQGWQP